MQNSWQEDNEYHNVITQRNIILILCFAAIIIIGALGYYLTHIISSTKNQIYLIQVDENSGKVELLQNSSQLQSNDSIALYFIEKYIHARENYSPEKSDYTNKIIQSLSSNNVLQQYLGYIHNEKNNMSNRYKSHKTYIKIKNKMKYNENTYLIRFNLYNTENNQFTKHAAVISIAYQNQTLSEEELKINPLGLKITGYKINEEK